MKKRRARRKQLKSVPVVHAKYRLRKHANLGGAVGETDFDKKTIAISRAITDVRPWALTFWHEWFHAVFHELGYEADNDNEAKVEALSHAVMRMLTDSDGKRLMANFILHLGA